MVDEQKTAAMVRTEAGPGRAIQRRIRPGTGVEAVVAGFTGELSTTDLGLLVKAVWLAGRRAMKPPPRTTEQRLAATPAGAVAGWALPLPGGPRAVLEDRRAWCTAIRLLTVAPIAAQVLPSSLLETLEVHLRKPGRPRPQEP